MSTNTTALPRNRRILEARRLFETAMNGRRPDRLRAQAEVMETMTTSDFPILLGAAYDREMLAEYQGIAPVWQRYSARKIRPNFKPGKLIDLLGGRSELSKVAEAAEYPARPLSEAEFEFKVEKYGDRIPLTWEMLVNDELDAFTDLPSRLATAARETEDIVTARSLFNAAGTSVNTDFFKSGNGNAPGTAALTSENLEAALQGIATRTDSEGRPVVIASAALVVPPGLELTARRILNASEIRRQSGTGSGSTITVEPNYMRGAVDLVVNPWFTYVAPTLDDTWFVLPAPSSGRPALVTAFLRGNESPDLRVKADAGNRPGGGEVAAQDGSFDDDTVQYRVRHVTGSTTVIPTGAYASTPAG